jgi:hypothetical protein
MKRPILSAMESKRGDGIGEQTQGADVISLVIDARGQLGRRG